MGHWNLWVGWIRLVGGLCASLVGAALSGCTTVATYSDRRFPTETLLGEKFAVVLQQHEECRAGDCRDTSIGEAENEFSACLANAASREVPGLMAVAGTEFRRLALGEAVGGQPPRTPAELMQLLHDTEFRQRINATRLRYVVVLSVVTSEASLEQRFSRGHYGTWGIGNEWKRTSKLSATVVDLKEARESGLLLAGSSGKPGLLLPVVLVVPLPPVPLFAATESAACESLGRAVARFLSQRDT